MTNTAPTHFEDRVEDVVELIVNDWKGHDDDFFTDSAKRTISWYIAKAKTFVEYSAEIRKSDRSKVFEEVCKRAKVKPRRMYEAVEIFHRFAKPSDSVREITEKIYEECGNWSHALPSKNDEAEVEPSEEHNHKFVCTECGEQYHQ